MRTDIRDLVDTILRGVVLDEGFARELAEQAHMSDQQGAHIVAEGFRKLGRHHRIRAMKGRANMAALRAQHMPE